MKEVVAAAIVGLVLVAAILVGYRRGQRREATMVQQWAEKNHFELMHFRERAFLEPAPFSFWTSHRTPNYFVRVRDQQGRERAGWVRLGTVFESICWGGRDKVQVRGGERFDPNRQN
jgi:hypothetical protein